MENIILSNVKFCSDFEPFLTYNTLAEDIIPNIATPITVGFELKEERSFGLVARCSKFKASFSSLWPANEKWFHFPAKSVFHNHYLREATVVHYQGLALTREAIH